MCTHCGPEDCRGDTCSICWGRSLLLCEVVSSPFQEVCERLSTGVELSQSRVGARSPGWWGWSMGRGRGDSEGLFHPRESRTFHLSVRGQAPQTCSSFHALCL